MEGTQELLEATAEALGLHLSDSEFLYENVHGDSVISCYSLRLSDSDGADVSQVVYLETSPTRVDVDGILVFRDEATGDEIAVWIYPTDPGLPALPVAVFPDAALTVVQRMGVPVADTELTLVAYRPGKRAVVRVAGNMSSGERVTVWLKVVRPKTIEHLHQLYELWEQSGLPVPQTLGWSDEGLIGFTNLPGVAATSAVTELDDGFFDAVDALVADYARIESTAKARASLSESRHWYARKARERHPELAAHIAEVLVSIDELLAGVSAPPSVTIHADLHLGQLFIDPDDPSHITGVLDIDTAGLGDPADDAAAMYAHLIVSQLVQDDGSDHVAHAYAGLAQSWWARTVGRERPGDPQFASRFCAIAATHLIAHSLGGVASAALLIEHARTLIART